MTEPRRGTRSSAGYGCQQVTTNYEADDDSQRGAMAAQVQMR
jgi:hypothetical protein